MLVLHFEQTMVCLLRCVNLESIDSRRTYSRHELLQLYSVTRPSAVVVDHVRSVGLQAACCLRHIDK